METNERKKMSDLDQSTTSFNHLFPPQQRGGGAGLHHHHNQQQQSSPHPSLMIHANSQGQANMMANSNQQQQGVQYNSSASNMFSQPSGCNHCLMPHPLSHLCPFHGPNCHGCQRQVFSCPAHGPLCRLDVCYKRFVMAVPSPIPGTAPVGIAVVGGGLPNQLHVLGEPAKVVVVSDKKWKFSELKGNESKVVAAVSEILATNNGRLQITELSVNKYSDPNDPKAIEFRFTFEISCPTQNPVVSIYKTKKIGLSPDSDKVEIAATELAEIVIKLVYNGFKYQ